MTRAAPDMWFGYPVPKGVTNITIMRDYTNHELLVCWRVVGSGEIHEMPFESNYDSVLAALAAMKLTT
jgi:hypothetical protein